MNTKKALFTTFIALGVSALVSHAWTLTTYAQMEAVEKLFPDSPVAPSNILKVNITHADAYKILNHINDQRALQDNDPLKFTAELLRESEHASDKYDDPNLDKHHYTSDQTIILHGPQTAEEVIAAIFNNPEYTKHILNGDITEIGIGHTSDSTYFKTENNEIIPIDDPNAPIACWAICLKE